MRKQAIIIVGLGYGDEGKGLATDYFCQKTKNPIVVRFNGGQQAGHSVFLKSGEKHVFSNFGAGSLRKIPTYWSKYCTFSPALFNDELKLLPSTPKIFMDCNCPITTHYDILYNRAIELFRGKGKYGSCGLGFGATINRHKNYPVKFTVKDLFNTSDCINKLSHIRKYYQKKIEKETNYIFNSFNHDKEDYLFINDINNIRSLGLLNQVSENYIFEKWDSFILEGAQGILLDTKHGQYPYVTKSCTTSKNALSLIMRNFIDSDIDISIYYITRIYQTRHGQGPFKQCKNPLRLKNKKSETNKKNPFQGKFRISHLDIDMLNYSLKCDNLYSKKIINKNLIITCLDQINLSNLFVYKNSKKKLVNYTEIPLLLNQIFNSVKYSFSKFSEDLF